MSKIEEWQKSSNDNMRTMKKTSIMLKGREKVDKEKGTSKSIE